MNIYLSGKIAGLKRAQAMYNFSNAAEKVYDLFAGTNSISIVNPMKLPDVQKSWADFIIRDLMILKDCDAIVMLPNWENSPGAVVEHDFAKGMGKEIKYINAL